MRRKRTFKSETLGLENELEGEAGFYVVDGGAAFLFCDVGPAAEVIGVDVALVGEAEKKASE